MIDLDAVLSVVGLAGAGVLLIGIFLANVAVFKMQKALNEREGAEKKVSPWLVIGQGSYKYRPASTYEAHFGDGPLPRMRRFATWLILPGIVFGLGSLLIEKARQ